MSPALVFLLVAQLRNHSYPGQHAAEALKQLGLSWPAPGSLPWPTQHSSPLPQGLQEPLVRMEMS